MEIPHTGTGMVLSGYFSMQEGQLRTIFLGLLALLFLSAGRVVADPGKLVSVPIIFAKSTEVRLSAKYFDVAQGQLRSYRAMQSAIRRAARNKKIELWGCRISKKRLPRVCAKVNRATYKYFKRSLKFTE